MKLDTLIKLLQKAKIDHGNIEVAMDITDTNTDKEWDAEDDPNIIGIRNQFGLETFTPYDPDTFKLLRARRTLLLLPDYTA